MYFKESVQDEVLGWQSIPNGPWTPYSAVQLTQMLMFYKQSYEQLAGIAQEVKHDMSKM